MQTADPCSHGRGRPGPRLLRGGRAGFRAATEAACRALVQAPPAATVAVEVNPFGSDRFGVALVTLRLQDGSADRMVCVMDKQGHRAELTAPFPGPDWPTPE